MGQTELDREKIKAIIKEELTELARDSEIKNITIDVNDDGEVLANVTFGINIVGEDDFIGLNFY